MAHNKKLFSEETLEKYDALTIIDITTWLQKYVLPHLKVSAKKHRVLLHPTCAARLAGVDGIMEQIARQCAQEVVVPSNGMCCGAAGDRGFIFPEVARSATHYEKEQIDNLELTFDGYYSLARTCEISMMDTINRPYESIVYLVDETTEASPH